MPIEDLTNLPENVNLFADVCLVGSGPAAWTLSKELSDAGIRVLVLESGGSRLTDDTNALNETEDLGMPLFNGRSRVFGGSTESSGWRNRCTRFDDIDYERRPWVPYSGWPFGHEEVEPYLAKAAMHLGTKHIFTSSFKPPAYTGVMEPGIDEALLSHVYWGFGSDQNGGPTRFSNAFRARGSDLVRVVQHATVTHLNIDTQSGRIASVEITDPVGKRKIVPTRLLVLCAGGIENARLLLNSNRQVAAGLGNRFDLVGRFLMDHPRDLDMAVTLDPREAATMHGTLGPFHVLDGGTRPRAFVGGFALSAAVQRQEGLLNCSAWLTEETDLDDPLLAATRLVSRSSSEPSADLRRIVARPGHVLRALQARLVRDQPMHMLSNKIGFVIGSEQTPNRDSRVTLGDRLDRFGQPVARTDWRVGRQERASQGRLAKIMVAEFKRLGLPALRLARWIEDEAYDDTVLQDGCHPTGTTRLAAEPTAGVVDPKCEVFGVGGLFVAGSSTFPTASHANPTLMIVAMACRLADHIKTQIETTGRPHQSAAVTSADAAETDEALAQPWPPEVAPGTRVAVTGANGFIGGRLVERLTEQGAVVTCLNRGTSSSRVQRTGAAALRLDLSDLNATKAALAGVQVVFHCAYDWNDEAWNLRAMSSLIAAATENRCERFVHISSFVVYGGSSVGELTETTEETSAEYGYSRTKRNMELQLLRAHQEHGFPCAIIQPTVVYGPHSAPWTVEPAERLKYGTVILPDPADGLCPAVHVDDVVDAMLICATHPLAVGERFLVSGPDVVTWGQFFELLAKAAGVAGPRYMTLDRIEADNRRLAKLRRMLTTPEQLMRRAARIGPVRRALTKTLPALPASLRSELEDRLYGPESRRRGHVHLPNLGSARWMSGKASIPSRKARQRLGYRPRVSLPEGMASLEPYLRELFST